jgi:drug/metabolite transporter (DMT)-like permease
MGGTAAIGAATLAWAADNTLSRPLSDLDPGDVVAAKGLVGATASVCIAAATRASWPGLWPSVGILACGAIGFGASLRLYLRAQRVLGSARTGSVFAIAPFVGAVGAFALGEPLGGWPTLLGGVAIGIGVWLHLGEQHAHAHEHEPITHDHPHRHHDDHHDDHAHEPPVVGEHSHPHAHSPRVHLHAHGEDLHHRHHG